MAGRETGIISYNEYKENDRKILIRVNHAFGRQKKFLSLFFI